MEIKEENSTTTSPGIAKDGKDDKKVEARIAYFKLFQYADFTDYLLLLIGTAGAAFNGVAFPLFSLVFGQVLDSLGGPNLDENNLNRQLRKLCLFFVGLACISFVASYVQVACWRSSSVRQANKIRRLYLEHLLHMDIEFFDVDSSSGAVMQGITTDVTLLQIAIGDKMGLFIQNIVTFVVGLIIAFTRSWQLTLVGISLYPLMGVAGALLGYASSTVQAKANAAYVKANTTATEALSNIRTVASLQLEQSAVQRFQERLVDPYKAGIFQAVALGLTQGTFDCVIYGAFAAIIYYGAVRVSKNQMTGGEVIATLFCVVVGGFGLAQGMPHIRQFDAGRVAAARIFAGLARQPTIKCQANEGVRLEQLRGDIELKNVDFAYPARPDVQLFKNFNLTIPAGSSLALVGPSGSGKSSVVALIERFYDPLAGDVLVDGINLKTLNLKTFRDQIGYVNQEPVMFAGSVLDNLLYGSINASFEEVQVAAKNAEAHAFIMSLPQGYDTFVGERGVALSGGQRQRLAIARALLRNPKILLLDEATSALDVQTEMNVQENLDRLMKGKTSIIVAHRLSTIRSADSIAVVQGGRVVEQGPHTELMARDGVYKKLVEIQEKRAADGEDSAEEEEQHVLQSPTTPPASAFRKSVAIESGARGSVESTLRRSMQVLSVKPVDAAEPDAADDKAASKKKKKEKKPKYFGRLLQMNRDTLGFMMLGVVASAIYGSVMPIFSYVLAQCISIFFETTPKKIRDGGARWAAVFAGLGGACFLLGTLQQGSLGITGQRIAKKLRTLMFTLMLSQEIGFFDSPDQNSGTLSARLQQDALYVRGAFADSTAVIAQNLACVVAGYTIAFIADWRITLLVTGCLPFLAIGGIFQSKLQLGWENEAADAFNKANAVATDSFQAIRVISAYSLQKNVVDMYYSHLGEPSRKLVQNSHGVGAGYGLSNFSQYGVYALAFFVGGELLKKGELSLQHLLTAFFSILLAGIGLAQSQLQFPDLGKAQSAVQNVFTLLDRKPAVVSGEGTLDKCTGELALEKVVFAYPLRPNFLVFNGLDLHIPAGKSMALVGESGSGKSTIVGLLLRFYDPLAGAIRVDGVDIKSLRLGELRKFIGLVGQEPALFEGTLRENIRNGRQGATDAEIDAACRSANIYDFIMGLPEQFDTPLGERGTALSGGQRQRIAIARAILRNPRILLLDEATSALDAESEKVVQDALDKLMVGRTTVIVAHRLSTIKNADSISAFMKGKLMEQGTHDQLVAKKGYYRKLVEKQLGGAGGGH